MSALALTGDEAQRLTDCESVIDRGLQTFVEVGEALREIRDARLYRIDFASFEDYCQERWQMDRRNANRHIEAAGIVGSIDPTDPKPSSLGVARELPKDTEAARETWRATVEQHGDKPTAAQVRETRRQLETASPLAPDEVDLEILASCFREGGIEAARERALQVGVACPTADELAARPVLTPEPIRADTTVPATSSGAEVVDLPRRQREKASANAKRLRNLVSTCHAIREVSADGWDVNALALAADDRELEQAIKDIAAARRELAAIGRKLADRLASRRGAVA